MFRRHLQSAATVTVVAAVALSASCGLASARGALKHPGSTKVVQKAGKPTAVAMEAFPAGGKGSGTEEVCHQWTIWLNEDQEQVDNATTTVEILDASDQKKADIDAAMDAGCAVID